MKRLQGFAELLNDFVKERIFAPYAWGSNDCVTYAADAVLRITGDDPIADLRGTWSDEESANAVLNNLGGLIKAVDARFQRHPSKDFANRGDIMMVIFEDRPSLGICIGNFVAAPGDNGTLFIPRDEARLAWEV